MLRALHGANYGRWDGYTLECHHRRSERNGMDYRGRIFFDLGVVRRRCESGKLAPSPIQALSDRSGFLANNHALVPIARRKQAARSAVSPYRARQDRRSNERIVRCPKDIPALVLRGGSDRIGRSDLRPCLVFSS